MNRVIFYRQKNLFVAIATLWLLSLAPNAYPSKTPLPSGVGCRLGLEDPKPGDLAAKNYLKHTANWARWGLVIANIQPKVAKMVTAKLKDILAAGLRVEDGEGVSGEEFNRIFLALESYASSYGIKIFKKLDTVGVFPEGLFRVGISGFGKVDGDKESVNFAYRHELAHLFHVIQVRAILIESFGLGDSESGKKEELEAYLEHFEGGRNYRELEQIVTEISGFPHILSDELESENLYQKNVNRLLDCVQSSLFTGRLNFKSRFGFVSLYALFLSRAPLIVGKSLKDLAWRMPLIIFISQYSLNPGFRNFVHSLF